MTTENKRMSQLIGAYADLDLSQMLNGEIALPTDHNPVYKDGEGNIKELLSGDSAGYLEELIDTMEDELNQLEHLIIERVGIDDTTISTMQTFSSSKITTLVNAKQDTLTAGNNISISANNTISAVDTTYTAGTNVTIDANNQISAVDTTYTAGTNIVIDANNNNEISCDVIDDSAASLTNTYSSTKIMQVIADVGGVAIDDTQASTTTVYSSTKTENLINTSLSQLKELLYPVGCIVHTTAYSTVNQMREVYGGSDWNLIEGRMLIGADSTYTIGSTGGNATVTLAITNLPSHNHSYMQSSSSTGSTTLTVNQIPSHDHTAFYQVKDGTSTTNQGGFYDGLAMLKGNSLVSDTTLWSTATKGGGSSHYHSITRTSTNTGSIGSGTAIDIMNPYKAVYIWTRTA